MFPFALPTLDPDELPADAEVIWEERSTIDGALAGNPEHEVLSREALVKAGGRYYLIRHSKFSHWEDGSGLTLVKDAVELPSLLGTVLEQSEGFQGRRARERDSSGSISACVAELARLSAVLQRAQDHRCQAALVDIAHDLDEVSACLRVGAYRACLALNGRCLELILKARLLVAGITFNDDWMVGRLLALCAEVGVYADQSAKNILNLINVQRIVGVHAKERVPIPSQEQALMVTFAVLDAGRRLAAVVEGG